MKVVKAIWRMLAPDQRRAVMLMQLLALLGACSTAAGIAAIAPFFAVLGDPGLIERSPWLHWLYSSLAFGSPRNLICALGASFVAIVLLANAIGVFAAILTSRLALGIGSAIQTTLFRAYLERPYAFHTRTHSSVLCNNVVYQSARFTHGVLENLSTLTTGLLAAMLIIASIALVRAPVALAVVAVLAAGYGAIYAVVRTRLGLIGQLRTRLSNEQQQLVRDSLGAIREILLQRSQDLFCNRFEQVSREFLRTTTRVQLLAQLPRNFMECVAAAGLVAVALVLAARDGGLGPSLGTLGFLGFAAYRLLPILQQVFASIVRIRADLPVLAVLGPDLLHARDRAPVRPAEGKLARAAWAGAPGQGIVARDLWYRHAPERGWALRGVSFEIGAHQLVAIVGANGAGKSTLLELIAALIVPECGLIQVDGRPIDDDSRAAWQARIAYLPQQVFLLDATIAANVALGSGPGAIDEARLREAGRLARLDDFVPQLPAGYAARIGEAGVALSGGQRQRIGLARALYHDASLLLLDEPTGALDAAAESGLVRSLLDLRERCTIVLVTHRPAIARLCDQVIELTAGTASIVGGAPLARELRV